ncbi:unnamed protein product, partial [Mesorhabditis belari]|uniref:Uncharacterized protein n=1 Tax=Mesorhabditis belari TaxID=2138241 RepID=A0AAF3J220_9BILA
MATYRRIWHLHKALQQIETTVAAYRQPTTFLFTRCLSTTSRLKNYHDPDEHHHQPGSHGEPVYPPGSAQFPIKTYHL